MGYLPQWAKYFVEMVKESAEYVLEGLNYSIYFLDRSLRNPGSFALTFLIVIEGLESVTAVERAALLSHLRSALKERHEYIEIYLASPTDVSLHEPYRQVVENGIKVV